MTDYNDPALYAEYIPFDTSERAGVIVTAIVGMISLLCILGVLVHILVSDYRYRKHRRGREGERPPFLQLQVSVFIMCMFLSDLVQGVSGVIQIKWAIENGITEGPVCYAQGVMLQAGDNGTVVWNAIIAIHTFCSIVLGKRFAPWLIGTLVAIGWLIVAFLSFLGPAAIYQGHIGAFYGRAKDWCFISPRYAFVRIMLHCLPMALSATLILVLYFLVFLSLRGHLVVEGRSWNFYRTPISRLRDLNKLANKMLWYPIAYALLCAPITITRIIALEIEGPVPTGVWIFSMCFLYAMGMCDTIIYSLTRNLGPAPSWFPTRLTQRGGNTFGGVTDFQAQKLPQDFKSFQLTSPTAGQFSPTQPITPRSHEGDYPITPNSATKFAVNTSAWPRFSNDIDVEEGYEEGQEIPVRIPGHRSPPRIALATLPSQQAKSKAKRDEESSGDSDI